MPADDTSQAAPRSLAAKLDALFRDVKRPDPDTGDLREHTLAEVGAAIGRSPEYVGYLRYGQRDNPSVKVLRDLAKFFGVRVSDLADEDVPLAELKTRVISGAPDAARTMAQRLAILFETVDYTDEQVADAVGVTPLMIGHIRAGADIDVSVKLVHALAEFFGVPVSYLVSRADDPEVVRVGEQLAMLKSLRDNGMMAMAMRATMVRNPVGREALAAMVETFIRMESGDPS